MKILYAVAVALVLLAGCADDYPVDIDSLPKQQYIYFLTDTFNLKAREMETYYARIKPDGTGREFIQRFWYRRQQALFSPNGKKVLLDYQIMDANGQNRKYFAEGSGFAWSPDSKQVAFWYGDSLSIINAATHERKLVYKGSYVYRAVWGHDLRTLFYTADSSLYSIQTDGSNRKLILRPSSHSNISPFYSITHSPIDDILLFTFGNALSGKIGLGRMKSDGTDLQTFENDSYLIFHSWSPDGKKLLASSYVASNPTVYEINAETFSLQKLVTLPGGKTIHGATYSTDGKQVTFTLSEAETLYEYDKSRIFIMNADGSALKNLSADTLSDYMPYDRYAGWSR